MTDAAPQPLPIRRGLVERARAVVGAARKIGARGRATSSFPNDTPGGASGGGYFGRVLSMLQDYAPLGYWMPWEVLDQVEMLATYNPDYSQAVDNIRTLANSGHELFVDASSDLRKRRHKEYLEGQARKIQEPHGGIDGVIDKLLDQGATYGAMCGEWVTNEELTEVVDFVDINPKKIRFFWDTDLGMWAPFQKVTHVQTQEAKDRGQEVRNGCVRLDPLTFRYYAFDAAPQSPYGTPPFVAALVNIAIQRDMVQNMSRIVKKLGLLAVVDMKLEALPQVPGETDEAYEVRAGEYLVAYSEIVDEMLHEGGMVHFDDAELTITSLSGNAAGATNIFKQNEELVFSGLKSMPSVQGRSYSTTETYAGVAYDIIIRNTRKYQRAVKRVIESGYWLMMALRGGEQPEGISLKFHENKTLQRKEQADAEDTEINNSEHLWALGIIDQDDVAQRHGYSEPKRRLAEPPSLTMAEATVDAAMSDDEEAPSEEDTDE